MHEGNGTNVPILKRLLGGMLETVDKSEIHAGLKKNKMAIIEV